MDATLSRRDVTLTATPVDSALLTRHASIPALRNPRTRVDIVDVVRGIAVVLMAIDHVRVYSGVPAGGPDAGVFFTRWITHFVAPIFALLAGTSAYFHGKRIGDLSALGRWLVSRGLFLVLMELTVMRLAWTFNLGFDRTALAGVLWMLGWCMVLLAGLVRLPTPALVAFGVMLVAGHNLLDYVPPDVVQAWTGGALGWLWQIVYFGGPFKVGSTVVFVLFSIVPWIGVMALGYAFGTVFEWEQTRRDRFCRRTGAFMIAAFLLLRAIDSYGDRSHWRTPPNRPASIQGGSARPGANAPQQRAGRPPGAQAPGAGIQARPPGAAAPQREPPRRTPTFLRFLGTSKYPASLQFLLMTLGPALLLLGAPRALPRRVAEPLAVFGRTPMFYYLLHVPLIHVLALMVSLARTGSIEPWLLMNHPAMVPRPPDGYTWPLWLLYAMTIVAVGLLYFACRWYAGMKAERRSWWLSYV